MPNLASPALPAIDWHRAGRRLLSAALAIVVCMILANALFGNRGLVATIRAREQFRQLEAGLERLRAENARMREEVRHLREDPSTIDEIARRELGLMSPGETVFIIRDIPQHDPHRPAPPAR